MKALSIRQPWLYAILVLGKRVENRTWYTDYRGPLLLHASRTFDRKGYDALVDDGYRLPAPRHLPMGAIVGIATLTGVTRQDSPATVGDLWATGPYCWHLEHVAPLPPVPWTGNRGLFDVPMEWLPPDVRNALVQWLSGNGYVGTRWWKEAGELTKSEALEWPGGYPAKGFSSVGDAPPAPWRAREEGRPRV